MGCKVHLKRENGPEGAGGKFIQSHPLWVLWFPELSLSFFFLFKHRMHIRALDSFRCPGENESLTEILFSHLCAIKPRKSFKEPVLKRLWSGGNERDQSQCDLDQNSEPLSPDLASKYQMRLPMSAPTVFPRWGAPVLGG